MAGGHAWWVGGMHGRGMHGRGHAWQGRHAWWGGGKHGGRACVAGGMHGSGEHAWQGACVAGGMHGGGHVWCRGMCMAGGHAWQRGHAWWGGGLACVPWQIPWDMVNERAVRILLECILVVSLFKDIRKNFHGKTNKYVNMILMKL